MTHEPLSVTRWGMACMAAAAAVALSALSPRAQTPSSSTAPEVIVRGGWLYDSIGSARVRNTGIVVRAGKFLEVGANLEGRNLAAARVIDLDDNATILPGFF